MLEALHVGVMTERVRVASNAGLHVAGWKQSSKEPNVTVPQDAPAEVGREHEPVSFDVVLPEQLPPLQTG